MKDWIEGQVVGIVHWTDHLFTLRIDAAIEPFVAGQFTSLGLEIDGERIARPYSYMNPPGQKPLEFFLYTATGGLLSNALAHLEPSKPVWLKTGANGFFTLSEVPASRDLWMIATGTGVAPFYSILRTDEPWRRFERVVLVNAVRHGADLCHQDIIQSLREQHGERFRYQAFVSRESVQDTFPGRIPAAILDGSLELAIGLELRPDLSQLMLCGNPDMVTEMTQILRARGMRKNRRRTPGHITTENYW